MSHFIHPNPTYGTVTKKGKIILTPIIGKVQEYEFTLTPDGNTLRFNSNTYKRMK